MKWLNFFFFQSLQSFLIKIISIYCIVKNTNFKLWTHLFTCRSVWECEFLTCPSSTVCRIWTFVWWCRIQMERLEDVGVLFVYANQRLFLAETMVLRILRKREKGHNTEGYLLDGKLSLERIGWCRLESNEMWLSL